MRQLLFILLITFTYAQTWCPICGNDLQEHHLTNHKASLYNEKNREYCSLRCMVVDAQEYGIKDKKVRNYTDKNFIDVEKAWYVVGSDITGVHSKISKIAFATHQEAAQFVSKHNGKIEDFNTTFALAKNSLDADNRFESLL